MAHRIGVIGGDGIGPDVIAEGLKVIAATGVAVDTVDYDLGGARYLRDGVVLPDETIDEWRHLDALYLGAVGTPDVPPGVIERGLLLEPPEGHALHDRPDLVVHVRDCAEDPLAAVALLVAVSQLEGLVPARARAGRRRCAAQSPIGKSDVDFDGRVAAGVENLPRGDL